MVIVAGHARPRRVVAVYELTDQMILVAIAEDDELVKALLLDGLDESLAAAI